ncbi:MAG: hypothetical protein ACF8PN_06340 [Phycisphaerales bacterium]
MTARPAFTLIEMLLIISIIALLLGLLLPALSQAQKASKTTQCLSRLRGIGQGLAVYSSEYRGVIATGAPAEINDDGALTARPDFQPTFDRLIAGASGRADDLRYDNLNAFWFYGLARFIAPSDGPRSVWSESFFCPSDRLYTALAVDTRNEEPPTRLTRVSYLMTDAALWDPSRFEPSSVPSIIRPNMLFTTSESDQRYIGPALRSTTGRKYQFMSGVHSPDRKAHLWEANAFHVDERFGYNAPGLKANVLCFDGHAGKPISSEHRVNPATGDALVLDIPMRLPFTIEGLARDPYSYGATRQGLRGRDFLQAP